MALYLSIRPRAELIPSHDDCESPPPDALLDERERRQLRSYRPPTGIEHCPDSTPTGRWSDDERERLLALARATVLPAEQTNEPTRPTTVRPRAETPRRLAIRRCIDEVAMTEVRARLRGTSGR